MAGIPAGYEDFVRSHEELLAQFQDMEDAGRNEMVFSIYKLGTEKSDLASQLQTIAKLREDILQFIGRDIDQYQWNHSRMGFFVAIPRSPPCHLKGVIQYGNNVEDEWFSVYLLQRISHQFPDVAISALDDEDGQFLLIEAADHIETWIGPENALNRVWIRSGQFHILPLEVPGRVSGGVGLLSALSYLREHDCPANPSVQRVLNARTADVYPTKIQAHRHCLACILPSWAGSLLQSHPDLTSLAINAFSAAAQEQISKLISTVPIPFPFSPPSSSSSSSSSPSSLVAQSVPMTRTLYAQLAFKPFKMPRRLHTYQRVVQSAHSDKVTKAFEWGARLVCGLLLASLEQMQERDSRQALHSKNQQEVEKLLREIQLPNSSPKVCVRESSATGQHEADALSILFQPPCTDIQDAVQAMHTCLVDQGEASWMLSSSSVPLPSDSGEKGTDRWRKILEQDCPNDSDAWLYLDPEQLDQEMQSRMREFSSSTATTAPLPMSSPAASPMPAVEKMAAAQLAQEVQSFLSKESDYTGVEIADVLSPSLREGGEEEEGELDMDYVHNLVKKVIGQTEEAEAGQHDQKDMQPQEGLAGRSERFLRHASSRPSNTPPKQREEEDDEEEDEDETVDSDDESEEPLSESPDEEEEEEGEYEALLEDMDAELLEQEALRRTFAHLFSRDIHADDNEEEEGDEEEQEYRGPSQMTEEDMDMHLMMNLIQSHAEGLGIPQGPAQALLSQLGWQLPRPPPMAESP